MCCCEAKCHESPQFSELVVFDMRGSCSMAARPTALEETGPLGMAYESNGHVLHFGEVRCDRVRRCLERVTGGENPRPIKPSMALRLVLWWRTRFIT